MQEMTGGEIVVDEFIQHGVERVYCVPGESYLAVIDALFERQIDIQQITCRHESGAGMMALAEAELTAKPAICFVTRGPGASNASIAVHMAEQGSVPLILCVGQVASNRLGRQAFQEMDYQQFFGSTAKRVFNIETPEAISRTMQEAFTLAKSGRPGPVVLVFPEDVLRKETAVLERAIEKETNDVHAQQSADALAAMGETLRNSSRPLIIAGGSQWTDRMSRQLQKFAERNRIPVLSAFRRNDVIDNHSASFAGYLGLNQHQKAKLCVEKADCVLVIGARLDEPTTSDYSLPGIFCEATAGEDETESSSRQGFQWIHIYPDFSAIPGTPIANVRIQLGTASFLDAIEDEFLAGDSTDNSWVSTCRTNYEGGIHEDLSAKYNQELLDLPLLMRELTQMLPDDTVITMDAGNFTLWPQRFCQFTRPGRMLAPINGSMGYGVPSGIAASLAYPGRTVVTFVGDGGMMMTGMEMATALKYGAKPIIIVFNNCLYGTIDSHQQRDYPGRAHGNELHNPDFVQFAESFGAAAVRVATVFDFANAFIQAKQLGELTLIELMLHDGQADQQDEYAS